MLKLSAKSSETSRVGGSMQTGPKQREKESRAAGTTIEIRMDLED